MEINKKLLKDIEDYCKYNNIDDIEKEVNNILRVGFNIIRFGTKPFDTPPIQVEENKQEEVVVKKKARRKKKIEETPVVETTIMEVKEEPIQVKKVRIIKSK